MEETVNQPKTDKPWLWKKGQSGNPAGRPKGFSLKEWTRERLARMTDEEREEFLIGLPKTEIWKMSEGNPHSTEDSNIVVTLPKPILGGTTDVSTNDGSQKDN